MSENLFAKKNLIKSVREMCDENAPLGFTSLCDFEKADFLYLDHGYVGEVLTKDFVDQLIAENVLGPDQPVLISAQTGSGKSTFIFKTLLPIARRNHRKILYLVSRKAQMQHVKRDAIKDSYNGEKRGGTSFRCKTKDYNESMIENIIEFGDLIVMSYQEYVFEASWLKMEKILFVVMDEAHYFLSDADFNPYTEVCLNTLMDRCINNIRIYMTATADEVGTTLYEAEMHSAARRHCDVWFRFRVIYMAENYSYLDPVFFQKPSSLMKEICESSKEIAWLIFVRSKKEGKKLSEDLRILLNDGEDIAFITAQSNDGENLEVLSILKNEELRTRITFSTKVLDLGVNLKMENLRIAIFDDDIIEIKQMIGRYRLTSVQRKLPIYIQIPSQEILNTRLHQEEYRYAKLNQDRVYFNLQSFGNQMPFPYYWDQNNRLSYNRLSEEKWIGDIWNRKDMNDKIKKLQKKNPDMDFGEIYARLILQNFPQAPEFSEKMILDGNNSESLDPELVGYIQNWKRKGKLEEKKFQEFNRGLADFLPDPRKDIRSTRGNLPHINVRNKQLENYGVRIKGYTEANQKRYYLIESYCEEG